MRRLAWSLGLGIGLAGCGATNGDRVVAAAEVTAQAPVKAGPYTIRFDQGSGKALLKSGGDIHYINSHIEFSVDPAPPQKEHWELRMPNPTQPPESDWPDMSFSLRPGSPRPNPLDFTIPVPDGWRGTSYELNGDLVMVEERRFKVALPEVRCFLNRFEGSRRLRFFASTADRTLPLGDGVTVRVRKQEKPSTSLPVEISWDAVQVMPHLPEEKAVLGGLWSNMGFVNGHTGELETDHKRIWDLKVDYRKDNPIDPKTVDVEFTLRKPARRYPIDLTFGFKWE